MKLLKFRRFTTFGTHNGGLRFENPTERAFVEATAQRLPTANFKILDFVIIVVVVVGSRAFVVVVVVAAAAAAAAVVVAAAAAAAVVVVVVVVGVVIVVALLLFHMHVRLALHEVV